jgi:hypothetical protein
MLWLSYASFDSTDSSYKAERYRENTMTKRKTTKEQTNHYTEN